MYFLPLISTRHRICLLSDLESSPPPLTLLYLCVLSIAFQIPHKSFVFQILRRSTFLNNSILQHTSQRFFFCSVFPSETRATKTLTDTHTSSGKRSLSYDHYRRVRIDITLASQSHPTRDKLCTTLLVPAQAPTTEHTSDCTLVQNSPVAGSVRLEVNRSH